MEPDRRPLGSPHDHEDRPAPDVPDYLTMKEALTLIGERFGCSVRTLRHYGVHKLLHPYALGYHRGNTGLKRVPKSAIEEVLRIMHEGRIPT